MKSVPFLPNFPVNITIFCLIVLLIACKDDDEVSLPEVTEITPAGATPGTLVAIKGKFFSGVFAENTVAFNGVSAIVENSSSMQLNVVVPKDASSGPVTVNVNGRAANNHPNFTVIALPAIITSISPLSGKYNTLVTITGQNFLAGTDNIVSVNGVTCDVQSATETSITVRVPARTGTGPVIVNGVVTGLNFKYVPQVLVGGFESNGAVSYTASYWQDGQRTKMAAPIGQTTIVYDVKVVGDDVYTAGYRNDGSHAIAQVWKNGVVIPVTGENINTSANSVFVVGSDVYAAGVAYNAKGLPQATYWKNGAPVGVYNPLLTSEAVDIAVVGNDVYLSGYVDNGKGVYVAAYWKNGVVQTLTTGNSNAYQLFVDGTDVYIAGSEYISGGANAYACYWKNGVQTRVTSGTTYAGMLDIRVVDGDVFGVGTEDIGGKRFGKYWKNGIPMLLGDGSTEFSTVGIDIFGEDVYVAGTKSNGKTYVATYWKNGVPYALTDGSVFASAKSLVIR